MSKAFLVTIFGRREDHINHDNTALSTVIGVYTSVFNLMFAKYFSNILMIGYIEKHVINDFETILIS
jgi:hypothetical protein